jgi:hypothetical protein
MVVAISLGATPSAWAQSQEPILDLELNKVQQVAEACHFTMVVRNRSQIEFSQVLTDLFFFDQNGVVSTRLSLDLGRIRPSKTQVLAFSLKDFDCMNLSQVLLNDVPECEQSTAEQIDCTSAMRVTYRGDVEFVK